MRKVAFTLVIWLATPVVLLATWAEPTCDPAADPTSCNISAPINVSTSNQTKSGGLTLDGALITNGTITANSTITAAGAVTINATGSLTVNGNSTLGTITSGILIVNGTSSTFNSQAIFNNGMDVASKFNYTGAAGNFTITADSINDSEVSDTLTASIFIGTGSTTNAVDLNTAELNTTGETWVNTTGDTMTGTLTINPTTGRAIAIQPNTTSDGIWISGATGEALVSLNQTGNGKGIYLNTIAGVTGKGIEVVYAGSGYPVEIRSTGSSTRSLTVENGTTGGYGVYSKAGGTNSTGVAGTGTLYGTVGASTTGTGGFFITDAAGGTGLYATLNNTATTTSSKALEVVGKNGYGAYITADGDSATGLYVENTNTTGTYSVGYFKANGATASTGTTTALYAENTSTASGITKYAIQATATSPTGEGIYAVSDYGQAGHFKSDFGKGIYVDVSGGGTYGIDIDAPGAVAGINIAVDDGEVALDANNGEIKAEGGFRGGQFYANENAGNGVMPNVTPDYSDSTSLTSGYTTTGLMYDGSQIWVARKGTYPTDGILENVDTAQAKLLSDTSVGFSLTTAPVYAPGYISGDYVWVFSTASDSYAYLDRQTGSITTGSSGATDYPNAVVFDGKHLWLGGNNSIMQYSYTGVLSTRVSGLGNISDIIYADGYIWAADDTNNVVHQVDVDTYTDQQITVGTDPSALVYDGANVWVANYSDDTLTKISTTDNSTTSYTISSLGIGPNDIVFDGANIWIGFDNGDGVGYFKVADETVGESDQLLGASIDYIAYDGTYVWATDNSTDTILKIPTGSGFGNGDPPIQKGILIYNTSGNVRCLYISGSTVTASSTLTNCQ